MLVCDWCQYNTNDLKKFVRHCSGHIIKEGES